MNKNNIKFTDDETRLILRSLKLEEERIWKEIKEYEKNYTDYAAQRTYLEQIIVAEDKIEKLAKNAYQWEAKILW